MPVKFYAIAVGEDVVEAMELRTFGVGPRTWSASENLRFKNIDYAVMGFFALVLIIIILLRYFTSYGPYWFPVQCLNTPNPNMWKIEYPEHHLLEGNGEFWMPEALIPLAGG